MNYHKLLLTSAAALFSMVFSWIYYPGFMSYDSIHALYGARDGVTDSIWPPMVSYVWAFVDSIYPDPVSMLFFQVFLLFFSLVVIVYGVTKNLFSSISFLFLLLLIPVLLGTASVIWKDVLMASFFLMSVSVGFVLKTMHHGVLKKVLFWFAILLISIGSMIRHNAILAVFPLIFFLMVCYDPYYIRIKKNLLKFLIFSFVLTALIFGIKSFVFDRYSFPSFSSFPQTPSSMLGTVKALDIAGASVCANKNLFGEIAPDISIDYINNHYVSKHVNLSADLLAHIPIDERLDSVWYQIMVTHPVCFLYNKYQIFIYLIGLNSGDQFLITDPNISENKYNYHLENNLLRDALVFYVVSASDFFIFRPWFIAILSFSVLFLLHRRKLLGVYELTLICSGIFYFFGLVLFGNAADARLPFYSNVLFLLLFYTGALKLRGNLVKLNCI